MRPKGVTLAVVGLGIVGIGSLGAGPLFSTLALNMRTFLGGSLGDAGAAALMLLGALIFAFGVAALWAAVQLWRLRTQGWRLGIVVATTGLVGMGASVATAGPSAPLVAGAALFIALLAVLAAPPTRRAFTPA
jgi:hypothetical protein